MTFAYAESPIARRGRSRSYRRRRGARPRPDAAAARGAPCATSTTARPCASTPTSRRRPTARRSRRSSAAATPAQPYQRFTLKQPPLTYVSAPTRRPGARSTLEVRVNDVLWEEVPTLYGAGPRDRVYVTATDDDGDTTVEFGDGVDGRAPARPARERPRQLPQGHRRSAATSTPGSSPRCSAGRSASTASVNPEPATGGEDPEALADARAQRAADRAHARPRRLAARLRGLRARLRRHRQGARALDLAPGSRAACSSPSPGPTAPPSPPTSDPRRASLDALRYLRRPARAAPPSSRTARRAFRLERRGQGRRPTHLPATVLAAVEAALRGRFSLRRARLRPDRLGRRGRRRSSTASPGSWRSTSTSSTAPTSRARRRCGRGCSPRSRSSTRPASQRRRAADPRPAPRCDWRCCHDRRRARACSSCCPPSTASATPRSPRTIPAERGPLEALLAVDRRADRRARREPRAALRRPVHRDLRRVGGAVHRRPDRLPRAARSSRRRREPRAPRSRTRSRYRRRKGTAAMLEQLARDVTGWDARAVEYFELLATTQYMNHRRPRQPRRARRCATAHALGCDRDGRSTRSRARSTCAGSQTGARAATTSRTSASSCGASAPTGSRARRRRPSAAGPPAALPLQPARPRRAALHPPAGRGRDHAPRRADQRARADHRGDASPATSAATTATARSIDSPLRRGRRPPSRRSRIAVCDLRRRRRRPGRTTRPPGMIAIDPVLGRLAWRCRTSRRPDRRPRRRSTTASRPTSAAASTTARRHCSSRRAGGRQRASRTTTPRSRPRSTPLGGAGVVEITDSGRYARDAADRRRRRAAAIELRAARRPPADARPRRPADRRAAATAAACTLNGLLVAGDAARRARDGSNALAGCASRHCTLVPGRALDPDGAPALPGQPASASDRPGAGVETVERSIIGARPRPRGLDRRRHRQHRRRTAPDRRRLRRAAAATAAAAARSTLEAAPSSARSHCDVAVGSNSILPRRACEVGAPPGGLRALQLRCRRLDRAAALPLPARRRRRPASRPALHLAALRRPRLLPARRRARPTPSAAAPTTSREMGAFHHLYAPQRETNLASASTSTCGSAWRPGSSMSPDQRGAPR